MVCTPLSPGVQRRVPASLPQTRDNSPYRTVCLVSAGATAWLGYCCRTCLQSYSLHCDTAVGLTAHSRASSRQCHCCRLMASLRTNGCQSRWQSARESRSQRGRRGRQSKGGRGFSHGGSVVAAEPPFKDPAEVKVAFAGE